jgi:hypothetical protein
MPPPFIPKSGSAPPPSAGSTHSRRGCSAQWCGYFVTEQLLDFAQIFSHVVKQDRRRAVAQPVGGDLPHPEGFAAALLPRQ